MTTIDRTAIRKGMLKAAKNYARRISLQTLVIGAYTDGRRDLQVPRLLIDGKAHP